MKDKPTSISWTGDGRSIVNTVTSKNDRYIGRRVSDSAALSGKSERGLKEDRTSQRRFNERIKEENEVLRQVAKAIKEGQAKVNCK